MSLPNIISRVDWGAERVVGKAFGRTEMPVYLIYVTLKSNLPECSTKDECVKVLKEAQKKAMITDKIGDIPYNFVIAQDGSIFEGRGWERKPQKAIEMEGVDFDPVAYDISFFGDFSPKEKELPMEPFKALLKLLDSGIKKKFVVKEYDLEPFRDDKFKPKFRPGKEKFKNIGPIKKKGVQRTKAFKKGAERKKSSQTFDFESFF